MRTNLLWLFLLVAPLALTITSCDDDDVTVNLMDALRGDDRFTTLVSALDRTGLDATVGSLNESTIFAPTNQAFIDLGVDLGDLTDRELSDILLYHVIAGLEIPSSDIQAGQTYVSSALAGPDNSRPGVSLLVEGGSGVKINGASDVVDADISSDNGVIHAIDAVLLPLDVVGQAQANSNFTALVDALVAAPGDLVGLLQGEGPFTVFAPLNSAFEDISDVVAGLTPEELAAVLTYHVVAEAQVYSDQLSDGQVVTTANGGTFTVNIADGNVTLTDAGGGTANVVLTDVQATNGVIHVLDAVIIPEL